MESTRIAIRGRELVFRTAGTGPAVILMHGMASWSATWDAVIPGLAERFTVIAPDLPGHGEATNPGGDYSLGAHATYVRDVMIALGIPRATIAGHSLGGGVAMQLAYQFPERCERLVLVDSGGLGSEVALYLRALALPGAELVLSAGCSPRVLNAGRAIAGWLRQIGLQPTASVAEVARCYTSLATPEARAALMGTLRSVINTRGQRVGAADRLHLAAHIPTLIVWGERDMIIPVTHAHVAHEAIAGSKLVLFPTAGHFPHAEDPERFVRELGDFIGSTVPAVFTEETLRAALAL
ncbi:MAG: alpha/beta fold hydrolase [Actinomycetota bacterium]|nr:alpha/beta fold hydrolase [Actinomycetota bacterium]